MVAALSPSRANDFRQCPLKFRFRSIDQIPEPPARAATLGTLVHLVLERLYDRSFADRTFEAACDSLAPSWQDMLEEKPELASLTPSDKDEQTFLADAQAKLVTYFSMENPQRLEPTEREQFLTTQLDEGPLIRGIVDRIEVAPNGLIRVVDYKTGKAPRPAYSANADFQMRFYALLVNKTYGQTPALLRLLYLGDGVTKDYTPTEEDLPRIEADLRYRWNDIVDAAESGTFASKRGPLCNWCSYRSNCPEFGGEVPELDSDRVFDATGVRPR